MEFYLVPAIDLLDCPDYRRVCFSFASGFKDIWFFRTRREQQHPMVSDKGGWYYWKCGGRASLNYLLERDMLRHRFPFLAGEDTPQTTLSHPLQVQYSRPFSDMLRYRFLFLWGKIHPRPPLDTLSHFIWERGS